jgi:hypothetical protein
MGSVDPGCEGMMAIGQKRWYSGQSGMPGLILPNKETRHRRASPRLWLPQMSEEHVGSAEEVRVVLFGMENRNRNLWSGSRQRCIGGSGRMQYTHGGRYLSNCARQI